MSDDKPSDASQIALEINGPGVSVETIDAPALLNLAASFFALVQGNAKDVQKDISLHGISITNKCVQIAAKSNSPTAAQFFAQQAHLQISGELPAPRGLANLVRQAQSAIRNAPPVWSITYKAGSWSALVRLATRKPKPMRELISLRAFVNDVAGAPHPHVRMESRMEARYFSLVTTQEQAKRLGKFLLSEVEIQASVLRDADGNIETGLLIDFEPLDAGIDTITEWQKWYQTTASEWNDVENIEAELKFGRN